MIKEFYQAVKKFMTGTQERGQANKPVGEAMVTMKRETYREKARGVEHFSGDIENTKGTLVSMVIISLQGVKNFYTVDSISLVHSIFHLNLIILSPLTVVNILLHTTSLTCHQKPSQTC